MKKYIFFVSLVWLSFLYLALGPAWKSDYTLGHIYEGTEEILKGSQPFKLQHMYM